MGILGSTIFSSAISGASSAFVECATNAGLGFFTNRDSKKKIGKAEVRHYVDEYIREQYPTLEDMQFVKDKLFEFIIEYTKYIQSKPKIQYNITVIGDVNINNGLSPESFYETSVEEYLKLPESQKWNEVEFSVKKEENTDALCGYEDDIDSLLHRAENVGIKLQNIDRTNSQSIRELKEIVEKYEKIYSKRR